MTTFVLVHGAWHGAWCWNKLTPLLERQGHSTIAVDLPGHGQNRRENIQSITLKDYTDCVVGILDKQTDPVVLVGHSLGGITISQAAEYRPTKIKRLVYLCAFLLNDGQCVAGGGTKHFDPLTFSDSALREVFYGDCTEADLLFAKARLVPQPGLIARTPLRITDRNFGSVTRVYIATLQDKAISPARQREMYTALPCERVVALNTSHSPFFSTPEDLTSQLIALA